MKTIGNDQRGRDVLASTVQANGVDYAKNQGTWEVARIMSKVDLSENTFEENRKT